MEQKQCKYCHKVKPLTDFPKRSKARSHHGDGHEIKCKQCVKEYMQSPERRTETLLNQRKRRKTTEGQQKHREENKRYNQTVNGKATHSRANRKYSKTEKGTIANRKKSAKYQKTESYKKALFRYRAQNPEKQKAQSAIANRIASGKIIRPSQCSICGKHCTPQGHHPDYSKPLEVVWVCRECHNAIHWILR